VINNLRARMGESQSGLTELKFKASAIPELADLVDSGKINSKIAQDVFIEMFGPRANRPEP